MKHEEAIKLSEQALTGLAKSLERGNSDGLKQFLEVMARFPKYSFRNAMLIMAQRPDASHVAGFHTWRRLGRCVLKGEKGIGIVAPMVGRKTAGDRRSMVTDMADSDDNPARHIEPVTVSQVAARQLLHEALHAGRHGSIRHEPP